MAKSIIVTTKRPRGRPTTTGKGTQVGERWHDTELTAIDKWIASTGETLTRGHAIRRLVEIGLSAPAPAKKSSPGQRERAAELAGGQIDRLLGKAHPEAANRKRRLIEGPSVVREERRDRPKKSSD